MALPKGFEMPATEGNYIRFRPGETQVRVMSDWIVGYEWWVTAEGGRKPKRRALDEQIIPDELEEDKPKLFWAAVVFDRSDEKLKIMEITQRGIMRTLQGLENDDDWGDPKGSKGYDIVIVRIGEGLETKYEVRAKPKKKLDPGIVRMYEDSNIKLEALFTGDNPFEEVVSVDDIEKALS